MSLLDVAWEEASDKVYDPFIYAHFWAGSGSGGVVCKLDCPCGLVPVVFDVFFHFRYLSAVGSLWAEHQDVSHAIGFVDGVRRVSEDGDEFFCEFLSVIE